MKKVKEFFKTHLTAILISIIFILVISIVVGSIYIVNEKKSNQLKNPYDIKTSPGDNFVFLGDSITEYYPLDEFYDNLPTINSGRSGWVTDQILDNIDSLVYIYNPTKVFLLIGTNDIEQGKSINDIVNNIEKITKKIEKKRPKTKIYIESIYPINNTNSEKINHGMVGSRKNSTIKKINKEIKDYCNENDYTYIDVYNNLTDKNGNLKLEYTEEGLHLSSLGYIKVTKILYSYLGDTN